MASTAWHIVTSKASYAQLDGQHSGLRDLVLVQLQRGEVRQLADGTRDGHCASAADLVAAQVQLSQPGQALLRDNATSQCDNTSMTWLQQS